MTRALTAAYKRTSPAVLPAPGATIDSCAPEAQPMDEQYPKTASTRKPTKPPPPAPACLDCRRAGRPHCPYCAAWEVLP